MFLYESKIINKEEFDSIYIPKTLKNIGMYTLYHPTCLSSDDCYSKNISHIEVEEGNPYFVVENSIEFLFKLIYNVIEST